MGTPETRGPTYPFSAVRERMRRHRGPVLDFANGLGQEPPPAWLTDLVRRSAGLALERARPHDMEGLVEAATGMLERVYGVRRSPAAILPAPGGRVAMSALAATLIAPGDRVLVTEPAYPVFGRLATQLGARLHVVGLDPERGFAPRVGTDSGVGTCRFAALNYPNNPTGSVISGDDFRELTARLHPEATVFNDATYGPLCYERSPVSLLADEFAGDGGQAVFELHLLSKLFSSGPLGIALIVGPDEAIGEVRRYSEYGWAPISALHALVGRRCLEGWEHVDRLRQRIPSKVERLAETLRRAGFAPYPVAAGTYLLCRRPETVSGRPMSSAADAARALLDDHGLAVVPWDVASGGYLRFSVMYRDEDLQALQELGRGQPIVST